MPAAAASTLMPSGSAICSRIARSAALEIELHASAEEIVGVEDAEHQVRIGDGGELAAAAVTDRTGRSAGAVGSNPQETPLHAGDRAAARRRWRELSIDRRVEMITADFVRAGHERLAVDHQRHVEARAAHVGGDDVAVADLLRQLQRAHHAAGGPAGHQEDRLARRLARGNDARRPN